MARKSSIHFQPVTRISFAVSHSERTELSEPSYLLPEEYRLSNSVVEGSLSESEIVALFAEQKEKLSGQAKARGSSPFWEGVVVLGNTDAPEQSKNLADWKKAYEQATGHRVLHISMHFDEGFLDKAGQPHYNPHAHVIVSRMNEKNRIIKLERKELAAIQDLTAETLKMERGSTLAERGGKRGREHIPHNQYRQMSEEKRLALDTEKAKTALEATLVNAQSLRAKSEKIKLKQAQSEAAKVPELQAQIDRINTGGDAIQQDYEKLKQSHDAALAELRLDRQISQLADLRAALGGGKVKAKVEQGSLV